MEEVQVPADSIPQNHQMEPEFHKQILVAHSAQHEGGEERAYRCLHDLTEALKVHISIDIPLYF